MWCYLEEADQLIVTHSEDPKWENHKCSQNVPSGEYITGPSLESVGIPVWKLLKWQGQKTCWIVAVVLREWICYSLPILFILKSVAYPFVFSSSICE